MRLPMKCVRQRDSIHASNRIVIAMKMREALFFLQGISHMIRIEDAAVWIHYKEKKYSAKKRLCDIESMAKALCGFLKTTLVNLKYIVYVEPYFNVERCYW